MKIVLVLPPSRSDIQSVPGVTGSPLGLGYLASVVEGEQTVKEMMLGREPEMVKGIAFRRDDRIKENGERNSLNRWLGALIRRKKIWGEPDG